MFRSAKRIYTEIKKIQIENETNPNAIKFIVDKTPFSDGDSDIPTIAQHEQDQSCVLVGRILPTSDIYNRTAFKVKLKIPREYPFKPPEVQILTPIYHPNIGPEGQLCIPSLRSTELWRSTNTLFDVINAIVDYIDHPTFDEADSSDIMNEYMKNRAEFDRKVAETVEKNMISRQ